MTTNPATVIVHDDRGAHDRAQYVTFDFTTATTRVVCDHLCSHHKEGR